MDLAAVLARLDLERRLIVRHGETLEHVDGVTRLIAAGGALRVVISSSLTPENADCVIAREVAHHRQLRASFEWKLYAHDQPGDLMQRLIAAGLIVGPMERVLVRPVDGLATEGVTTTAVEVRRVEGPRELADYRSVAEAALGKSYDLAIDQLTESIRAQSTEHLGYVAYANGQPVSVGRLYTHRDSHFAGLFGGCTLPPFRHRGYYRALIAKRAEDARALGVRYLSVDALPTSAPTLRRLGFLPLTETWPCTIDARR